MVFHVSRASLPTVTSEKKFEIGEEASHTNFRGRVFQAAVTGSIKGSRWGMPGLPEKIQEV